MTTPGTSRNRFALPDLGIGVGLRTVHYQHILDEQPAVDWFEIISENFMSTRGRPLYILDQVAERYPIAMHGVAMSLGSTDDLDMEFLKRLKAVVDRIDPAWVGDHVCWTGVAGRNSHDLLPMPYNEQSLAHIVERINIVQDYLGRRLVLENPSTYMTFKQSTMSEQQFIAQMANDADCGLLLDVNNVYVSCRNHGWDAMQYLEGFPFDRVVQIHLAGHTDKGTHCLDTHDGPVIDEVWQLYKKVQQQAGNRATLLEWDDSIPDFQTVHDEALRARAFRDEPIVEVTK